MFSLPARASRLWGIAVLCLCGCLLQSMASWGQASPSPAPSPAPSHSKPITRLKVVVRTTDEWGAGTEDAVWFSLGPAYEWPLVPRPGERAFRPGNADTFVLSPQGLKTEDIRWIRIRKGRGATDSQWLLRGVEVWVNGQPFFRKGDVNTRLEEGHLEWTAPDFPVDRSKRER